MVGRVRQLARLTVSLYKLGLAAMFGPGTVCRCSTDLPPHCKVYLVLYKIKPNKRIKSPRVSLFFALQWAGGLYPGTLLLYLQEIEVNHLLSQGEWDMG